MDTDIPSGMESVSTGVDQVAYVYEGIIRSHASSNIWEDR